MTNWESMTVPDADRMIAHDNVTLCPSFTFRARFRLG